MPLLATSAAIRNNVTTTAAGSAPSENPLKPSPPVTWATTPAGALPMFAGKSKVVAVTSGKGGVGKTFVSANFAAAMAQQGKRVLVVDLDLGLANLDVVLNLYPKRTLHDVLEGRAKAEDVLVKVPAGFTVLPAGSGLSQYGRLTLEVREQLLELLADLTPRFDLVLLDTGAGISDLVVFVLGLAQEVLVVVTPEPTSMTDAYAVIKVISQAQRRKSLRVLVNQVEHAAQGRRVTEQLQSVTDRFLKTINLPDGVRLMHMGDIPADQTVKESLLRRHLLMLQYPHCPAGIAITRVCARMLETILKKSELAA